jgi:zinc finger CCCH domain-containing protein 13
LRDSSRSRRDPSHSRRERDGGDGARSRTGDDRDDTRRDGDDYSRRERDDYFPRRDWEEKDRHDRDADDDPRRWRDDGKRDERQAARREKERGGRAWDDRDRADDRDGRTRRTGGRDRRSAALDDIDKKDERKEKEPAWMETYVPTTPGGGILGGQGAEGELDGIQAWKKDMKEREKKEKDGDIPVEPTQKTEQPVEATIKGDSNAANTPLDEIQMFKLLMKKEADKKDSDYPDSGALLPAPGNQSTSLTGDDTCMCL